MHRNCFVIVLVLLIIGGFTITQGISHSHSNLQFLKVHGDKIVNEQGERIFLRGIQGIDSYLDETWYLKAVHERLENPYNFDDYALDLYERSNPEFSANEIRMTGANVVRIRTRMYFSEKTPYIYSEDALQLLENRINTFGDHGIYTILVQDDAGQNDFEETKVYSYLGLSLWDTTNGIWNRSVKLWGKLASHFKDNPNIAGFEIVNKPKAPDKQALHDYYQDVIDEIRKSDSTHIIFLGVDAGNERTFKTGGIYDDDNYAISAQYYEPRAFTLKDSLSDIYPGYYNVCFGPDSCSENILYKKTVIEQLFYNFISADEIVGRPVLISEFGVSSVKDTIAGGLQWINDVMEVMNTFDLHYTFHTYVDPKYGYWLPIPVKRQQLQSILNDLREGIVFYDNLNDDQKKLFSIEDNYLRRQELPTVLYYGFKGKIRSFYVDVAAGNDNNPGSEFKPWKTIQAAVYRLKPGDTLYVKKGDYREEGVVTIDHRALGQLPLIIMADYQGQTIVEAFQLTNCNWIQISGFTFSGPKILPENWLDMPEVIIDDSSVVIDPDEYWLLGRMDKVMTKYATYTHFWEWDNQWSVGIDIISSQNISIINNDISLHTASIVLENESSYITIENNTLHHCLDAIRGEHTGEFGFSFSNTSIKNNRIYQIFREGIRLIEGAQHSLVENNDIIYTGHSHIVTHSAAGYHTIKNNTVQFGGYYSETMNTPGSSGISLHSSGPGCTAIGNYIAYQYDVTLNDGNGIIMDYNPDGASLINNVIYRVMGSGITSAYSGNSKIIHNTIIECGYNTPSLKNGVGFRAISGDDVNNIIANNIFYKPLIGGLSFENGRLSEQKFVDYNLFYLLPEAPLVENGLTTGLLYFELSSYQETGYGLHSVVADPMFLVADSGNYHVQENSPAIQNGTSQYTIAYDKDDYTRLQEYPTIGAYEYQGTSSVCKHSAEGIKPLVSIYPNPFNLSTKIAFDLSAETDVEIRIYNILGKTIKTLVKDTYPAGHHLAFWNGDTDSGSFVSSGIYFARGRFSGQQFYAKLVLIK